MKRREFVTLLGGTTAAWPLAARAQQRAMPVIGFLSPSFDGLTVQLRAFRQGLKETGHVEGENMTIEYRSADNQLDRLSELASQLVQRKVDMIATASIAAAGAAKAATSTIPVVFAIGEDPVRLGLVASLSRPGGNLTGVNFFSVELAAKRVELLRELAPAAARLAILVNPTNRANAESTMWDVAAATRGTGLQLRVLNAATNREIEVAFASLARERLDALYVSTGAPFSGWPVQLALLAARSGLPAVYGARIFVEARGLMSYGATVAEAYRQAGVYAGRILKGAKPADLPVVQTTKFELVINAATARMLDLNVPPTLLARADEVIE